MKKNVRTVVVISVIILIVGIWGLIKHNEARALQEAKDSCTQLAKDICEEYDIKNVVVSISEGTYEDYRLCNVKVEGTGASSLTRQDLYMCIRRLEGLGVDFDDTLTLTYIYFDGSEYSLDVLDSNILERDGEEIYTYVSQQEKDFLNNLAQKLPYEDMSEKYIGDTVLGEPDEEIKCRDYYSLRTSRRSKTYKWYNDNGSLKASVHIMFMDDKLTKNGYGYVTSVNTYDYDTNNNHSYNYGGGSYDGYDDGYNDVYEDDDYDWDRYYSDPDYASGVDDAMEDAWEEYGEEW